MNHEEFEFVYQQYYGRILAFIRKRIVDFYEAEELTGDVFFYFYRSIHDYDVKKSSVATWLYTITANRLKNYYRDKKEHLPISDLELQNIPNEEMPEEIVLLIIRREELQKGLEQLSQRDREVLIYKYFWQQTSREIAENMKLSAGSVRMIQKRSLAKLRKIMEEQGR